MQRRKTTNGSTNQLPKHVHFKQNLDDSHQTELQSQINRQQKIIEGLKSLVVNKESQKLKSPFEQQLTKYLGTSLNSDIQNSLNEIVEIYRDENNELEMQKYIKTKKHPNNLLQVNKCVSTEDDYNLLLAACKDEPKNFLGELSFEIEFRILKHVFGDKINLYGMSSRQIDQKIIEVTTDYFTLQPNYPERQNLMTKYEDLLRVITDVGYKREFHPSLTEHYITNYGAFNYVPKEIKLGPDELTKNLFKNILRLIFPDYKKNKAQRQSYLECKTLINVIFEICRFDGQPVFSWKERNVLDHRKSFGPMGRSVVRSRTEN